MQPRSHLEDSEQQTRSLIELLDVFGDILPGERARRRIENMNRPGIGQPARPAIRCVIALDGAEEIPAATKPHLLFGCLPHHSITGTCLAASRGAVPSNRG